MAGARRLEVEEARRPLDGHRTVTGAIIVHILTKVDKGLRPSQLSSPQVSFRNDAPQMSGGGIIFGAGEARISEIEEEARHPLDGHPTVTAARTVC